MTVESNISKITYLGNGKATLWPVPFAYGQTGDIRLLLTAPDGTETALASGWRVEAGEGGTSVIYPLSGAPLAAGAKLTIYRDTPRTQIVDLIEGGAFDPETLERDGFDRAVMMIQEIQEELDRAVKVSISSDEKPDTLRDELFAAGENAAQSAAAAAQSAYEARSYAARTAEIKAAALRELNEEKQAAVSKVQAEGDGQAKRLNSLAEAHILTFEREVERAHDEAERAEAAAAKAGQAATLAVGDRNLEASWELPAAVMAGEVLNLPVSYIVGRNTLRLSWGGVELYRGVQFSETGEPESLSDRVILHCNIPAGGQMNAWVVASNVARGVETAEAAARAAAEAAELAAEKSARLAGAAEAGAERAEAAAFSAEEQARTAAGFAADAGKQAAAAGENAEAAEASAERAGLAAALSGRGGLFTVQSGENLQGFPQGFYVVDKELKVPALAALPLTSVEKVEDLPGIDCYAVLGGGINSGGDEGQSGAIWPPSAGSGCICPECGCSGGGDVGSGTVPGGNPGGSEGGDVPGFDGSRVCILCGRRI